MSSDPRRITGKQRRSTPGRGFRHDGLLRSGAIAPPELAGSSAPKRVELHGISFRGTAKSMMDHHSAGALAGELRIEAKDNSEVTLQLRLLLDGEAPACRGCVGRGIAQKTPEII